jgi:aminoglycoside phosphotransferase (APT) family kinase protein
VKTASHKAQRMFAASYREEARKLAALPAEAPAPRLLWTHDDEDWMVLSTEYVDARQPHRPWRPDDLTACVAMVEGLAAALTPPPAALALTAAEEEFAGWPAYWDDVRAAPPGPLEHVEEAAALAARYREVVAGDTLVHTDIRDDNLLLDGDGRVLLCDWNWPSVGAAWLDTVFLMIGPRGDGLDVDAVLASSRLTRDVPAESVDIVLALVTGYFLMSAQQPVPATSPHVRDAQRWQGEVCWGWLAERRRW